MTDATALRTFADAARDAGRTSLFPALEEFCQSMFGHRLFSCSAFRLTGGQSAVAARIYTSDDRNYPLSGLKEIVQNRWTEIVIGRQETFLANTPDGFADVFPDHPLITSLGLGSVVNVPVVFRGDFLGTVNMLDVAHHYSEERLARIEALALPAMLAFQDHLDGW